MGTEPLGLLERVNLRGVWPLEAGDFTPWLAANLALLGATIGIELELESQETGVGPFERATRLPRQGA